ncbi:hypothetical protein BC829DRAFT_60404 [Chytridium lagenaria]|nr:hypothetical protein BC829DRAFT_60404 [Chytridium lagenaria]
MPSLRALRHSKCSQSIWNGFQQTYLQRNSPARMRVMLSETRFLKRWRTLTQKSPPKEVNEIRLEYFARDKEHAVKRYKGRFLYRDPDQMEGERPDIKSPNDPYYASIEGWKEVVVEDGEMVVLIDGNNHEIFGLVHRQALGPDIALAFHILSKMQIRFRNSLREGNYSRGGSLISIGLKGNDQKGRLHGGLSLYAPRSDKLESISMRTGVRTQRFDTHDEMETDEGIAETGFDILSDTFGIEARRHLIAMMDASPFTQASEYFRIVSKEIVQAQEQVVGMNEGLV